MKKQIALGLLGLLTAGVAHAQAAGFYVGGSYLDAETEWLSETDDDSGYEVRAGYMLDENFSLEVSYFDLGTVKLPEIPDAGGKAETDGYAASVLGSYPIGALHLTGKIGYLWAETDGFVGSVLGPRGFETDENELLLGVGLSFDLTDNFAIRLEYNESDHFNWAGLGVDYRF